MSIVIKILLIAICIGVLGGYVFAAEKGDMPEVFKAGKEQGRIDPAPGRGTAEGSKGIALVGSTPDAASATADKLSAGTHEYASSGWYDKNTGKDLMILQERAKGPSSTEVPGGGGIPGGGSAGTGLPGGGRDISGGTSGGDVGGELIIPGEHVPEGQGGWGNEGGGEQARGLLGGREIDTYIPENEFKDRVSTLYRYDFPLKGDGTLDFPRAPIGIWQPSSLSSSSKIGGGGRICINASCNPDVGAFHERDASGKFRLGGNQIKSWSPFTTGGSGPRLCMADKGCVTDWKLSDSTLSIDGFGSNITLPSLSGTGITLPPQGINLVDEIKLDLSLKDLRVTGGYGL